jgi:hypothetical protein
MAIERVDDDDDDDAETFKIARFNFNGDGWDCRTQMVIQKL